MYRIITSLLFVASFGFAQDYDFQELCIECAESEGYYCGDDPSNWTQYAPNGCVPNGEGGLFYLNDGWDDCVDGSDEADAVPTYGSLADLTKLEVRPTASTDCDVEIFVATL